jgi:xanthosine utilization system XapX-like protein
MAALTSVVALVAGALVGFAPAASAVGQPEPPTITWSACDLGQQRLRRLAGS